MEDTIKDQMELFRVEKYDILNEMIIISHDW